MGEMEGRVVVSVGNVLDRDALGGEGEGAFLEGL